METVTATLNGSPVQILFSGLAPGFAGVYQVNLKLPASIAGGEECWYCKLAGRTPRIPPTAPLGAGNFNRVAAFPCSQQANARVCE